MLDKKTRDSIQMTYIMIDTDTYRDKHYVSMLCAWMFKARFVFPVADTVALLDMSITELLTCIGHQTSNGFI